MSYVMAGWSGFGAVAQVSATDQARITADVDSALAKLKTFIDKVNKAVEDKVNSASCMWGVGLLPPASTCRQKRAEAKKLYDAPGQLRAMMLQPGNAPNDPPGVPLIQVRPQDVKGALESIVENTKYQGEALLAWANRSEWMIYWQAFVDALSQVLAKIAVEAGKIAGETARQILEETGRQLQQETTKTLWSIAAVGGVVALGIWLFTRRRRIS